MRVLTLPKLGSTMDEGTIVGWHVAAGDRVQAGDVLYEVTTDKVNMEVEADQPLRVVKLLVPEGATVAVGSEVVVIASDDDEDLGHADERPAVLTPTTLNGAGSTRPASPTPELAPTATAESRPITPVRASPAARQQARARGIDLTTIAGTGPRGRITRADVEAQVGRRFAAMPDSAGARSERGPRVAAGWEGPRAVIAQRMSQSALIPQVTLTMPVDMRAVLELRTQWTARGTKLSVADFVLLAVSRMLLAHCGLNGWAENGQYTPAPGVDLGYAVDVANNGLYVVTIRDAHKLTLSQIAEQRQQRTERVVNGRATLDDLGRPSFTVSNLGPMGVETFNPLLMPPQVGILGVGAVQRTATEDRLLLSLTFDHRVIDGAPAAWALKHLKDFLEVPGLML